MKKGLVLVISIALLAVAGLIIWDLFFKEDGVLETFWTAIKDIFNGFFGGLFGSDSEFIPEYDPTDDGTDSMDVTNPFG